LQPRRRPVYGSKQNDRENKHDFVCGAEKGPPFPAGTYAVYVSIIGNFGTPKGRRFFHVDGCVPMTLKP
jgi:hypothetical protein